MTSIVEVVSLPAGATVLHPLDLPEPRRVWLRSWLVKRSAPLAATLAFIGLVLVVEDDLVGLAVVFGVPGLVWAGGWLGGWLLQREAWAYIPRQRCDLERRQVPLRWTMLYAAATAAVFGAVAGAIMLYDVGSGPAGRPAVYGVFLAVLAGEGAIVLWRVVRRRWRRVVATLPTLIVLLLLTGLARVRVPHRLAGADRYVIAGFETVAVMGAVLVVFACGTQLAIGQRQSRRQGVATAVARPGGEMP